MISRWHNLRLNTQIAIVSAVLLAVTIFIATAFNVNKQQASMHEDLLQNAMALGRNLSSTLTYHTIQSEYDAIEQNLLKAAEFPEVKSIKLTNLHGVIQNTIIRTNSGDIRILYTSASITLPQQLKNRTEPLSIFDKDSLFIWYPLKSADVIGWLNLEISLAELKSRRIEIIRENIIGAIAAIVFDIFILLLVLITPTKKIQSAITVTQQLDSVKPELTNELGGSRDLNALFSALNSVALRLNAQNLKIQNQTNELTRNNIELSQAKDELEFSKDRFDRAINGANDGLWDCDLQTSKVWCSQRFNSLLGREQNENSHYMQINDFLSYFHPEDRTAIQIAFDSKSSSDETLNLRCRLGVDDTNYSWFMIRGRIYQNPAGLPMHVAGSIMDISEQVRVDKMKDEFVATISHELRTPLTSIKGSLELLNSGVMGKVNQKMAPLLDIASRNSERLLQLINDILDISKIESGKAVYHFKKIELTRFINECIDLNQGMAVKFNVSLECNIEINEAWVNTDEKSLHQVMSNVISNAIKFSQPDDKVIVHLSEYKDNYRIAVIDNGPGIDKAYQPYLFNKFTQEQSSLTRSISGSGLGLSITKSLIEQLGGELSYLTSSTDGTTFFIDLPIYH